MDWFSQNLATSPWKANERRGAKEERGAWRQRQRETETERFRFRGFNESGFLAHDHGV